MANGTAIEDETQSKRDKVVSINDKREKHKTHQQSHTYCICLK